MQTIENDGLFLGRDFLDFFNFRHDFCWRILPQKMFYFFYLSHFGGCEDNIYISTQQIDGWADTLKTCNKTPHWWSLYTFKLAIFLNKPLMTIFNHLISSVVV